MLTTLQIDDFTFPEKLRGTSKLRIATEVVIAVKKEDGENVHDDEEALDSTDTKVIKKAIVLRKVEGPKMSIESLKFPEKYELPCKRGEEESLQNVARESFEKALIVVQTTLEAEDVKVHRNVSIVKDKFVKHFENLLATNKDFVKSLENKKFRQNHEAMKRKTLNLK